jgi:inorganic triphosphatase YgiF
VSDLAALSGTPEPAWDAVVAQTFRSLGAYRDVSTVVAALHDMLSAAGSPEPSLGAPDPEVPDPEQQVRSTSFQLALLRILADAREPFGDSSSAAERPPSKSLRLIASRLAHLQARLKKDAKRFEGLEPVQQHAVRKRLKRLRYLAELVRSLYDRSQVDRYIEGLRPAQDALGEHVDLLVGLEMAREAARTDGGDVWFNVGYLSAKLPTTAAACRRALAKVAGLRPFW